MVLLQKEMHQHELSIVWVSTTTAEANLFSKSSSRVASLCCKARHWRSCEPPWSNEIDAAFVVCISFILITTVCTQNGVTIKHKQANKIGFTGLPSK